MVFSLSTSEASVQLEPERRKTLPLCWINTDDQAAD